MRIVIQRVASASVMVEGKVAGEIGPGLLALVGVEQGDTEADVRYCVEKTTHLRIFHDDQGKMNRDVLETGGVVLAVSQFTLSGDVRKGRRPSFTGAEAPERANALFQDYVRGLTEQGLAVGTGVFQAHMEVALVNDGPVTILISSRREF